MEFVRSHKLVYSFRNVELIDQGLLIEVLCRLPPKILMRFCCVCKPWYVLIHNYCVPRITPSLPFLGCDVRVRALSRKLMVGRAAIPEAGADVFAWPPMFNMQDPTVGSGEFSFSGKHLLDSRDGLMLFRHPSENKYVLWNPTTKQFRLIPCPGKPGSFAVLTVEIRNWKPYREMDFFKIVSFPESSFPEDEGILNVFSSHNSTWVERKVKCVKHSCCRVGTGKVTLDKRYGYLLGKLYTICHPNSLLWFTIGDGNAVVEFNFVLLPKRGSSGFTWGCRAGCIGSCGGRIQYVQNDEALRSLQIWVLNLDAREWTRIYSIKLDVLRRHPHLVNLRTMFPTRTMEAKFKTLAFDPVSDDGVIIWTPNLIFCYYYRSGKLVPLQCSNVLNDALKHRPGAAFAFTRCLASLALPL